MSDVIPRLNSALEGRYRVDRQIGEGGMATVYLADDLRHERKVALKVLKPELAAVVGAERFLTEIKTTAALNHPHILPLHDSGEADGFLFYVMPYVEGETLRERLQRERQLPVDEAVAIATAVAQALQHAHERGVIHRDIKPANILMQDGQPVVSDFGIALAVGSAGGTRLTETGLSVGTPFYMSPEQATGDQHVGPPSDTYALAAVLYEMLTGDPPYIGSTAQAVLGKIIQGTPVSATAARRSVPPHVDAAIRKALEKLPADRFPSAKDFAKALTDPGFRHGAEAAAAAAAGPWKRLAMAASAVAVVSLAVAAWAVGSGSGATAPSVVRFTVPIGTGDGMFLGGFDDSGTGRPAATSLALSPDGEMLVYAARDTMELDIGLPSRLYRRRLGDARSEPIVGTEGAGNPFFSPDGAWIGFFAGGALRRMPADGGSPETLVADADVPDGGPRGATWGDDGTIVYAGRAGLYRVPAAGGQPDLFLARSTADLGLLDQPHSLPGSSVVLFTAWEDASVPEGARVLAVDLADEQQKVVLTDAMDARYVESGHLLFMRRGTLMAVPFDPARAEPTGQPFIVQEDVMQAVGMTNSRWESGASQVAISRAGHLAYAAGGVFPEPRSELVRVGLDGAAEALDVPEGSYLHARVSPTGDRVAFNVRNGRSMRIRVHDLTRGGTEPLNTGDFSSNYPVWSPDGSSIAFRADRGEGGAVYRLSVDGGGAPELIVSPAATLFSWSVQGAIAYRNDGDLWIRPPDGEPERFFTSDAQEAWATFSPDGRWLAYAADQSGRFEVYVRPYPGPGNAVRVSLDGGDSPTWSPDGRRIQFLARGSDGTEVMMRANVVTEPGFRADPPTPLIDPWPYAGSIPGLSYDVLPDGSFIAIRRLSDPTEVIAQELHVVLNFTEELRARTDSR